VARIARDDVLAAFREGVRAIDTYAQRFSDDDWSATACGDWSAAQVAAHVRIVAGWYHDWLDRAERGDATPAFGIDDLPARNEAELGALAPAPPGEHVRAFVASASAYADRLPPNWGRPFGYPRGTITAGQHAALATVEWHVHAWDLARVLGEAHAPSRPDVVAAAAADAWVASQPGATVMRAVAPLLARRQRDPWGAVLRRMDRG
jgi:uncharacterized protein (TIGR03083 family)